MFIIQTRVQFLYECFIPKVYVRVQGVVQLFSVFCIDEGSVAVSCEVTEGLVGQGIVSKGTGIGIEKDEGFNAAMLLIEAENGTKGGIGFGEVLGSQISNELSTNTFVLYKTSKVQSNSGAVCNKN